MNRLYTIGHSNHDLEHFRLLLKRHAITAVGDVRSSPYSKFNPQYNREPLQKALRENHIAYVFLGGELGPRSDDPACYLNGKVQYKRLAMTDAFERGLERLRTGMKTYCIALMCAEKDPITCHRMILVCRALRSDPLEICHILEDGSIETLQASERRLMRELKMLQLNMLEGPEDLIQRVYDAQGERIAYVRDEETHKEVGPEPEAGNSWNE
jgi:uncharacterized protein (DUF488 family)